MRVLVCGGRDFSDKELMHNVLGTINGESVENWIGSGITCIIHGDASGADRMADNWAASNWISEIERYPAKWKSFGKSAGRIRNLEMIIKGRPDLVIAFPGGNGTANMVKQAHEHGIKVMRVEE